MTVAFRPVDPFCLVEESVGTVFFRIFRFSHVLIGDQDCVLSTRANFENILIIWHLLPTSGLIKCKTGEDLYTAMGNAP